MTVRRKLLWLAAVALLCGAAAHLWFWYRPGPRQALPPREGVGPRAGEELWVWIPFPHRNLSPVFGDEGRILAAAARLVDVELPRQLPTFGPFELPPASELIVASSADGERYRVEARVDPVLAVIARTAGRVAGNPWLAGGTVSGSSGQLHVDWRGSVWSVRRGEVLPDAPSSAVTDAPVFGVAVLANPHGPVPAGPVVLVEDPAGFVLRRPEPIARDSRPLPDPLAPEIALFLEAHDPDRGTGGYLLWNHRDGTHVRVGGSDLGLPALATFRSEGSRGWKLPARGLFRLLGRDPARRSVGNRVVESYGEGLATAGAELLSAIPESDGEGQSGAGQEWTGALRPRLASDELSGLLRLLEAVPFGGKGELGRWRAADTLLQELSACSEITLHSVATPARFELRCALRAD